MIQKETLDTKSMPRDRCFVTVNIQKQTGSNVTPNKYKYLKYMTKLELIKYNSRFYRNRIFRDLGFIDTTESSYHIPLAILPI